MQTSEARNTPVALEAKALEEFKAHVGKVVLVRGWIFGYKDHDSAEWQIDKQVYPRGIRVLVLETSESDVTNWNDEWLDPYWNVELIDVPEDMKEGRSFWIYGTSLTEAGETKKDDWELATGTDAIIPVRKENTVQPGDECQEASQFSVRMYIPCSKPATEVVYSERDQRSYYMCEMCAWHNVNRRGMKLITVKLAEKNPAS